MSLVSLVRTRRMVRSCVVGVAVASLAVATGSAGQAQTGDPEWLQIINAYRTSAGLPAVAQDTARLPGAAKHAIYLAMTGAMTHGEDSSSSFYSPEGHAVATKSVVGGWRGSIRSDRDLIDGWMTAPFHAIHFFDPRLQRIAYASASGLPGASLDSAAVLDVLDGRGPAVAIDRPITFPANGSTTPLTTYVAEVPDPLTSCPGYAAPAGLPLLALFPSAPGAATVQLSAGGQALETCLIDSGYRNPDAGAQTTGRTLLTQKNAVIIVPRRPLQAGSTYTVRVDTKAAGSVEWSFTAQAEGGALPSPSATPVVIGAPVKAAAVKSAKTTKAKTTKALAKPKTK